MDRALCEPPCGLSTLLSESWDYLCATSLPDGRFLTIYWPSKRGNVRGPNPESIWTGSSSSLTHRVSLRTGKRFQNTGHIYFLKTNGLPFTANGNFDGWGRSNRCVSVALTKRNCNGVVLSRSRCFWINETIHWKESGMSAWMIEEDINSNEKKFILHFRIIA